MCENKTVNDHLPGSATCVKTSRRLIEHCKSLLPMTGKPRPTTPACSSDFASRTYCDALLYTDQSRVVHSNQQLTVATASSARVQRFYFTTASPVERFEEFGRWKQFRVEQPGVCVAPGHASVDSAAVTAAVLYIALLLYLAYYRLCHMIHWIVQLTACDVHSFSMLSHRHV